MKIKTVLIEYESENSDDKQYFLNGERVIRIDGSRIQFPTFTFPRDIKLVNIILHYIKELGLGGK